MERPSVLETSQHMDDIRFSSSSTGSLDPPNVEGCGLPPPTEVRGQGGLSTGQTHRGAVGIHCLAQGHM